MIWRAALAAATVMSFAELTPASAQGFPGWEDYGHRPFWEQQPRGRHQGRDDDDDDAWGSEDNYRRAPIVRSGGPRPMIAPQAPPKVAFHSNFAANSIVIDSESRVLYFILSPTQAYQYPISVGREGFSWTGSEVISRKQEWPDWHPPKEMIARDPRLPDKVTGGLNNPLGALALYLGNTLYRIHGTNEPKSIGRAASSGCFRMMNEHVLHLASIAPKGTLVTVIRSLTPARNVAAAQPPATPRPPPVARDTPPPEHSASASEHEPRSAWPDRDWDENSAERYDDEDREAFEQREAPPPLLRGLFGLGPL